LDHHPMVVIGNDEVRAGSLVVSREQQMRVRDCDGIGKTLMGMAVDIDGSARIRAREVGFKFADEIQWHTGKRLIFQ
jgi:hypothetical protein